MSGRGEMNPRGKLIIMILIELLFFLILLNFQTSIEYCFISVAAIAKKKRKRNKNNARNTPQKGKNNKRNNVPQQSTRKDSEQDENER